MNSYSIRRFLRKAGPYWAQNWPWRPKLQHLHYYRLTRNEGVRGREDDPSGNQLAPKVKNDILALPRNKTKGSEGMPGCACRHRGSIKQRYDALIALLRRRWCKGLEFFGFTYAIEPAFWHFSALF